MSLIIKLLVRKEMFLPSAASNSRLPSRDRSLGLKKFKQELIVLKALNLNYNFSMEKFTPPA